MNTDLLKQYFDENRLSDLINLFEAQFDSLRRAEALNMLYINEIRNLKFLLESKSNPASKLITEAEKTQTKAALKPPRKSKPDPISEIEL